MGIYMCIHQEIGCACKRFFSVGVLETSRAMRMCAKIVLVKLASQDSLCRQMLMTHGRAEVRGAGILDTQHRFLMSIIVKGIVCWSILSRILCWWFCNVPHGPYWPNLEFRRRWGASSLNLLEDVEWAGHQAQGTSRVPGVQIGEGQESGAATVRLTESETRSWARRNLWR